MRDKELSEHLINEKKEDGSSRCEIDPGTRIQALYENEKRGKIIMKRRSSKSLLLFNENIFILIALLILVNSCKQINHTRILDQSNINSGNIYCTNYKVADIGEPYKNCLYFKDDGIVYSFITTLDCDFVLKTKIKNHNKTKYYYNDNMICFNINAWNHGAKYELKYKCKIVNNILHVNIDRKITYHGTIIEDKDIDLMYFKCDI